MPSSNEAENTKRVLRAVENKNVHMIGHDDESMKLEASLSAIAEKCVKKEFGVGGSLKMAMLLERGDCDGIRAQLLTDCGHGREHTPGAEAPILFCAERAKPEGLAYPEAAFH